jgi:acetylornithine deacetylase
VPYPTLNLGHIHGGDNPNRICPSCEVHFDLRPLPGMSLDVLREQLRERVDRALVDTDLGFETHALFPGIEAFQSPPEATVVKLLAELSGKPPRAVAFGTEAPFYAELGIETVVFGPGSIDQAHQPNEYIEQAALGETVEILRALIRRLCLEA